MLINRLSNRAFAWLIASILCASITVALIVRSWDELGSIARFIGYGVSVVAIAGVVYCVYRVFDDIHTRRIKRDHLKAARLHEVWKETQELLHRQQLEHKANELEQERLQLEQLREQNAHERLMLAASWQTQHMLIPEGHTAVFADPEQGGYLPIHNPRQIGPARSSDERRQITEVQQAGNLPDQVRYEDIRGQVPRGHIIVGIGQDGVETKERAVGALTWIVGLSGTGKTSTTVVRVEERHADGHMFLGIDPHFFKDDSLTNALAPYVDSFLLPMARTAKEINEVLRAFLNEFNGRKSGRILKPWQKITLLIDEVGSLMDVTVAIDEDEKALLEENKKLIHSVARICGQEARNFEMGGVFISQQATELAWLRKVALMIIVHQLGMNSERELATNGNKAVMRDMEYWPIGRTYVYGVGFGSDGPRTVQQPYFKKEQTIEGTRQDTQEIPSYVPNRDVYVSRQMGPLESPVGPSDATSEIRQDEEYARLSDEQVIQVKALFKVRQNIDYNLKSVGAGSTRYRQHARTILQEMKDAGEI